MIEFALHLHTLLAMKKLTIAFALAALGSLALPTALRAQATSSATAPRLEEADKKFIKDFVEQHLFEQELVNRVRGKQHKAQQDQKPNPITPPVNGVYKKVSGDLTKSWTEFATLSQAKNVTITTTAKPADTAVAGAIGKLEGEKFEKEFLKVLGKEAKKTDTLLTNAAKSTRDAEIKAFVAQWAPAFKAHLAEIENAEKAMKAK
jgi:putative membrane protein